MRRASGLVCALAIAACGGATAAPTTLDTGVTPRDCDEIVSIQCNVSRRARSTGERTLRCTAPARASDALLILYGRTSATFGALATTRISACEVIAALPRQPSGDPDDLDDSGERGGFDDFDDSNERDEVYVAMLDGRGRLIAETRPVRLEALRVVPSSSSPIGGDSLAADPEQRAHPIDAEPLELESQSRTVTYHGEVILTDVVSMLTMPIGVGLLGYFFGAPIVHLINDNTSSAKKSFWLRLAPVGVIIGTALVLTSRSDCHENRESGCFGEAAVAILFGAIAAGGVMIYDWTALSKVERRQTIRRAWFPTLRTDGDVVQLGLRGVW